MIFRRNRPETVKLIDIKGKRYVTEREKLIEAAQNCIREQFASAVNIQSADEARDYLQVLLADYEHEVFTALWLDTKHNVIAHDILFRGTIDAAPVYPREIVKAALSFNAAAVIFAHNHPSGVTEPSPSDIHITKRLKDALALVDIRTLDHLIVGSDITSMSELGML